MQEQYSFLLPIGDWANDKHGIAHYYIVQSNIKATDLIPIYNKMDAKIGISNEMCSFGSSDFSAEFTSRLQKLGFYCSNYVNDNKNEHKQSRGFAQLIVDLLLYFDAEIELRLLSEEEAPIFNNWLAKSIGTELNLPGLGLFGS